MKLFQKKIKLPTTVEEFDTLVNQVVNKYKLSDATFAACVISVAIRKLDNHCGYTTLDYLGGSVIKALANHVANYKNDLIKHADQIRMLSDRLYQDPNDLEARDQLQLAANNGSEAAKEALKKHIKDEIQLSAVVAPDAQGATDGSIQK